MIQIVFSPSKIKAQEWDIAYSNIVKIACGFPFKLLRIESYDGFSSELDKYHSDIFVKKGSDEEYISFCTDNNTFKGSTTVKFYKKWEKQISDGFNDKLELDNEKPIYWYPIHEYAFTGHHINANGSFLFSEYFDSGAIYRYVVLSIGLFLENFFAGRVLLIIKEYDLSEILETKKWTEWILKEKLDMPVYLDKQLMCNMVTNFYESKEDLVGRIENLYSGSFIDNMTFSIDNIGYKPTLKFYSKLLSTTGFMTFGFSDILHPWIYVTKDLEKSLELIEMSRKILHSKADEKSIKEAEKYDYKEVLSELLSNFILWTPEQREKLDIFYTNKNALQTGHEDLFGTLMRLGGYRIDICPIHVTKEALFETFMYFNPKEGLQYQQIINDWIENNKNSFDEFTKKLANIEREMLSQIEQKHLEENANKIDLNSIEANSMLEMFPKESHFFIKEVIDQYPYISNIDSCINDFIMELISLFKKGNSTDSVVSFYQSSREDKLRRIVYMIKEKRMNYTTGANFIKQVEATDEKTMTDLFFILATKVYDEKLYIARQHLIYDNYRWHHLKALGFTDGIIKSVVHTKE